MKHIVIHPGFHKTGTTTIQHFFWRNKDTLAPYVQILLLRHLRQAANACTRYSRTSDPLDLVNFVNVFTDVASQIKQNDTKKVLLSCEGLSGCIPGQKGITSYQAAPMLAVSMAKVLCEVFSQDVKLTFIYTTRSSDKWLHSAYRHNLEGMRLTEPFEVFAQKMADAADFPAVVQQVQHLNPKHQVSGADVDAISSGRFGLAQLFLDALGVPAEAAKKLTPQARKNIGAPASVEGQLLDLNQSDLGDAALWEAKLNLRKKWFVK